MQLNNQTGADHHKKEKDPLLKFLKKMINLLLFQKPNLWMQIGRCQWRRPSMILQGQKHPAKSRQTSRASSYPQWAKDSLKALWKSFKIGTQQPLEKWWAILLRYSHSQEKWTWSRQKDLLPLRYLNLSAMDYLYLHISRQNHHSRTMTPTFTIFYMELQTKELLSSLLKSWFGLETLPSTRILPSVDIPPMDIILLEKLLPRLYHSPQTSRSYPGRSWRLEKEHYQCSLEESTWAAILISTKIQEEMMRSKDFVENMELQEEKKNIWWQDQSIPRSTG